MSTLALSTPPEADAVARPGGAVVYLRDDDYPWDVRVEKICAALTGAGYDVHIVARNRARAPRTERLAEGTVHRMPAWPLLPARVDAALGFPAFFNPRWVAHLARVVRAVRPRAIVARDLPLCPTAIGVGRLLGVPVLLDMAENYPAMTREIWDARRQRAADVLVRNPAAVAAVERWCLPRVDGVLAVVEESAARVRSLGVPEGRVHVVSNTPPRAHALAPRGAPARRERALEVVYLGLLEIPRGVAELVDAVALLRARGVAVRATVVGDGRDAEIFRDRARARGLDERLLRFTGYVPRARALELVAAADVGVVPHHASDLWNSTIPNKLFDYMAAGLPVVTSDAAPAARIVRETGAGVVFRAGDAESLAAALARLAPEPARRALGEAGRRAVLERYHWERDVEALLAAVASLEGARA